jgi:hypothetical protein
MPAIRQVAPIIFKEVLEATADWKVYTEDRWNWSMVNRSGISVEIPKRGRRVSFQVMENILALAELPPGEYFRCLSIVEEGRQQRGLPIDGIDDTGNPLRVQ